MGCSSCSTGSGGQPRGCRNNGTCGTDGCNKLTVFDWLSNMSLPGGQEAFDGVEVRFKNSRKEFFRNTDGLSLAIGDVVATQAKSGHDVGIVTLTGELVKAQMRKKGIAPESELPKIYRKATQKDIDKWQKCRGKEEEIKKKIPGNSHYPQAGNENFGCGIPGRWVQGYFLLYGRRPGRFQATYQRYG